MKEENKIRLMRYGLGILHGIIGFLILEILDSYNYDTVFSIIILMFFMIVAIASILWSCVLIGRCEAFIDDNYSQKNKEEKWKKKQ